MSPKPNLAASAILLQRDIKTVSCPVTGISPCRCSDSSCYRHSIMMLCQYVKRKKEDRIVSMGVSHDKLQKCRDPVKMIRYRQTAFLYFSGTALDRRGGRGCSRNDMTVSRYGKPSVQGAGVIKKGRDNKTIINQSFGSL